MATNVIYEEGNQLECAPTAASPGTTVTSGDPVVVGKLPGVALTDADDTIANSGRCTVKFDGVIEHVVEGKDGSGNAAVAKGDIVYLDAGKLNVDATNGVRFGYALGAVVSGNTSTTIQVKIGY